MGIKLNVAVKTAVLVLPLALTGCATFHQAHQIQIHAEQRFAQYQPPAAPAVISTVDTPYLMGTAIHVQQVVPSILKQSVTLVSSNPLTIQQIAARISELTGIPVRVDNLQSSSSKAVKTTSLPPLPGMNNEILSSADGQQGRNYAQNEIPLNWHGSVSGLLDYATAKEGVFWKYRDGAVHIFRTETATFSIPALAWSTKAKGSIVAAAGTTSDSSGSSSGASSTSSSGSSSGQSSSSTGSTTIQNTSAVDVWGSLQKTAETVAGKSARVMADASTGTLTVTGTPPEVDQVRQWVRELSRQLSRQVEITVHVYDVQMNNEQNYGLNLSGVFNSIGKRYGVDFTGIAPPTPTGNVSPMTLGASVGTSPDGEMGTGSAVAVQALATLGHVTQVFSRNAVTMNGQPVPIQVAKQTSYLAENSTTNTANVGSTSGLIPGTVTTGFTAMFLPRVVNGRVLLGMNMTISNLVSLTTDSSGGDSIQVPTVDSSTFQQSASLKPGQTLLLTGYSQSSGNTSRNGVGSPYFPLLGGGADATTSKQMIAIVVTARVL